MFDAQDLQILAELQANARTSNAEIARQLGMAPSAVLERIRKLDGRRAILDYEARLAPEALGLGLLAFVFVRANEQPGRTDTGQRLAAIRGVMEVHHIAGEDCYLVKLRAADTADLARVLTTGFGSIPTVASTKTTIVLGTVKESARLPLPEPAEA